MLVALLGLATSDVEERLFLRVSDDRAVSLSNYYTKGVSAYASYYGNRTESGFKQFEVSIYDRKLPNELQMYVAGYAEGYLTHEEIENYRANSYPTLEMEGEAYPPKAFKEYVQKQLEYFNAVLADMPTEGTPENSFWKTVNGTLNWLDGLAAGLEAATGVRTTREDVYYLQSMMDFESLEAAFSPAEYQRKLALQRPTHCSGFVYPAPDYKELFFSHVSWTGWEMGFNRIVKSLNLHLDLLETKTQHVQYSSYPGLFFSLDDFYLIKNQDKARDRDDKDVPRQSLIAVLETTFNNFNASAGMTETIANPNVTLTWMRAMLASLNTMTPRGWTEYFNRNLSATYTNNYVALDYGRFHEVVDANAHTDANGLKNMLANTPDILWSIEVADQETTRAWDATPDLFANNYFASINSPQNLTVRTRLNYSEDPYYDYNKSARLATAKATLGKQSVRDLDGFKAFMRSNAFMTDPYGSQHHDPREGISSRYDLCGVQVAGVIGNCTRFDGSIANLSGFSAVDTKIATYESAANSSFYFLYGPTYGSDEKGKFPAVNISAVLGHSLAGVPDVLPLFGPGEDKFYRVSNAYCYYRDDYCDQCFGDYEEKDGVCQKVNYTSIILALSIPLGLLVVGMVVWTIFFFRKPKYNRIQSSEAESTNA